MKSKIILILTALPTLLLAQAQPLPQLQPRAFSDAQMQSLPENYQLTLSVSDNDKPVNELSIVVATTDFRTDTIDPKMNFTGTLTPEENGSILVRYTLTTEFAVPTQIQTSQNTPGGAVTTNSSMQYKTSSTQASVRLRLNEPLQILKSGSRVFRLTIVRLADTAQKAK